MSRRRSSPAVRVKQRSVWRIRKNSTYSRRRDVTTWVARMIHGCASPSVRASGASVSHDLVRYNGSENWPRATGLPCSPPLAILSFPLLSPPPLRSFSPPVVIYGRASSPKVRLGSVTPFRERQVHLPRGAGKTNNGKMGGRGAPVLGDASRYRKPPSRSAVLLFPT